MPVQSFWCAGQTITYKLKTCKSFWKNYGSNMDILICCSIGMQHATSKGLQHLQAFSIYRHAALCSICRLYACSIYMHAISKGMQHLQACSIYRYEHIQVCRIYTICNVCVYSLLEHLWLLTNIYCLHTSTYSSSPFLVCEYLLYLLCFVYINNDYVNGSYVRALVPAVVQS